MSLASRGEAHATRAVVVAAALAFLAEGGDNSGAESVVVDVAPRRGATYLDLVDKLLGGEGGGAVRLRGDGPFLASSRTFTPGVGTPGTYGVSVPAVSRDEALAKGIVLVRNEPGFRYRSNAGFVNPSAHGARVLYRVRESATGRLLYERPLDLPPEGFAQVNDLLSPLGGIRYRLADLVVEFVATASADVCGCPAADCCVLPSPVFAFATTIDNDSGDSTFQLAQPDPLRGSSTTLPETASGLRLPTEAGAPEATPSSALVMNQPGPPTLDSTSEGE